MNKDTIGLTSKTSAAARANESQQPDPLFIDIFASVYASQDGGERRENMKHTGNEVGAVEGEKSCCWGKASFRTKIANASLRSRSLLNSGIGRLIGINIGQIYQDIALRTRFLDDVVENNITNVRQMALLACGGDFRPYRLPSRHSMVSSSDLTFYLLDVPHVLRYRQKCFTLLDVPPTTPFSVVEIPCDLSNEEWGGMLCAAGFAIDRPTLWLAEGFLHYLTEQQIASLFNRIRQLSSSEQTCIAFDLVSTRFQASVRHAITTGLFHFALDDENEVCRIFSKLDCYDIKCTSFQELGSIYRRPVSRDRSFIVQAKISPAET